MFLIGINSAKTSITLVSVLALVILNFVPPTDTIAQTPYLRIKMIKVLSFSNATSRVYCEDGDGIISGGYSIGFSTINDPFNTMLYSNHPIQKINKTGYFEGWEAGLANKGIGMVTITATTLCLNLTITR